MRTRVLEIICGWTMVSLSVAWPAFGEPRQQQVETQGGGALNSIGEIARHESNVSPASSGTVFVPLDSWVYPALERLAALGYVDVGFLGMRPWTRLECIHLLQDARDAVAGSEHDASGASETVHQLEAEFAGDTGALDAGSNHQVRLESMYSRLMGITGPSRRGHRGQGSPDQPVG